MIKYFIFFVCLFMVLISRAQDYHMKEISLEELVEEIFSVQDNDLNYEELYESLLLYYLNPLNINEASRNELRSLFILSEVQIGNLLDYRKKYGDLQSIYELQAIEGFSLDNIHKLLPFVMVRDAGINASTRPLLQRILHEPNNYLLLRYERTLEEKKGYSPVPGSGRYDGSPDKLYTRFRTSHTHDFSLGFTAEKDAGEKFSWKGKDYNGFDFYSFHLQLQNKGRFKNIIVGDYQLQFGQGLLLAAGFSVGKGAETITTVRRSNLGVRPYSSVVETGFFRGACATYHINRKLAFTGFYSRMAQDALVRADLKKNDYQYISSIQSSGFHRTRNEISSRNSVIEQAIGGHLLFHDSQDNLQIGITYLTNTFNLPLIKSKLPQNTFEFSGQRNYNVGLSYEYNWNNISFFGEMARSQSGGIGAVGGVMASLTPHLETAVVLRNYDRNFHSFYGAAFAESSGKNRNERGWYWGLKYSPSRKYQFTAYFDQFNFPWLKFRVSAPSHGYGYLFRFNFKPNRETYFYFQLRQESKPQNISGKETTLPITLPLEGTKKNYTLNADINTGKILSFKSRVQWSSYNFNNRLTHGYTMLQDVVIHLQKFIVSARFALFDTDDYENRQYAYERDVLYSFSIPAYSGKGTRQYVVIKYKLTRKLDLWIKYARTHYRDRKNVSSGLEEIAGNIKTDLKLQARLKF